MKTVEELFKEIEASKDLQKELTSIGKGQFAEIEAFLKKHDCFIRERKNNAECRHNRNTSNYF